MQPFGCRGTEVKYLIVVKEKEVYSLDLETFEKSKIDSLTEGKFTGMCTYVEDGKAHIAVSVDFKQFVLFTYQPPKVSML
jgi:hypothetical protein